MIWWNAWIWKYNDALGVQSPSENGNGTWIPSVSVIMHPNHHLTFGDWIARDEKKGLSKNTGTPKMDGENHGKPYERMADLGGENPVFFGNPHILMTAFLIFQVVVQGPHILGPKNHSTCQAVAA